MLLPVIPPLFAAYRAATRSRVTGEHPATEDAATITRTGREFADAEAFEERWRGKGKKHQPDTLL